MGTRIKVGLLGGEKRKYLVKTHSARHRDPNSSAAKPVNPQELLVSKVREHLGVGCKTHFLKTSVEDVCIATLHAGHGGSLMYLKKQHPF